MTRALASGPSLKLPSAGKGCFLSLLLRELTLRARGAYDAGKGTADGRRLRVFNELSNRIAARLADALSGTGSGQYPEDVFVQMLVEVADQGHLTDDLQIAFERASAALGKSI